MTTLQKEMLNAVGHNVEVHTKGTGKPICGVCTNYTQPVDNDPEVATIDVKVEDYEGIIEITEADIVSLRIRDRLLGNPRQHSKEGFLRAGLTETVIHQWAMLCR